MKNHHKVAVIGGTGKSGKYLVKKLIEQGFKLRMLLRNPENLGFEHPAVEVVKGDARIAADIEQLLASCTAVISTLGQPKGEAPIFSTATKNVIAAMHTHHLKRYLVTTGLSVDTPFDLKSEQVKQATAWMKANYAPTTMDKQVEYALLTQSHIDWTLVRLPLIEQTAVAKGILVSLTDCPGSQISATDLANFLIATLSEGDYIGQAPFIASI